MADERWVATFQDRLGFETVHLGEDEAVANDVLDHFMDDNRDSSPRGLPYHERPRMWLERDGIRLSADLVWCHGCGKATRHVAYVCRQCGE